MEFTRTMSSVNERVIKIVAEQLGVKEEFRALQASCEVIATWDDHDYGQNDGGKDFSKKVESQQLLLDFW